MPVRLLLISMLMLSCCAVAHAADSATCPSTITTKQELTSSVSGWTSSLDKTPHDLAGVTFFDGPPSENASLVYDRMQRGKGQQTAVWTFATKKDRPIWLTCSYSGTAIQLSRSLPPQITTCSVVYDAQEHVAGLPAIKKIDCR